MVKGNEGGSVILHNAGLSCAVNATVYCCQYKTIGAARNAIKDFPKLLVSAELFRLERSSKSPDVIDILERVVAYKASTLV